MSVFPSNSIPIFILLCFTSLFHIPNVTADEEILLQECSDDVDDPYDSGSQFQTNLEILLDSLVANGSNGYYNTSVGESLDNIVYGLAQCRGDLTTEHCSSCLTTAKLGITQDCNGKSATLRYDRCMLRYSDVTFFSVESTERTATYYTADIADEYFGNFSKSLEGLMNNLSDDAASTPARYSFGQTKYAPFEFLYGAMQCTRDLSESDCKGCLEHLSSYIPTCCNASEGAKIVTETCYMRYHIEKFVEGSSQSPGMGPTSSPGSPPSSNQTFSPPLPVSTTSERSTNKTSNGKTSNGNDGGKSFNFLYIIVAIIASIMLE